jgi:hypothetical protein
VKTSIADGRIAPGRIEASAARLRRLKQSIVFANAELATQMR